MGHRFTALQDFEHSFDDGPCLRFEAWSGYAVRPGDEEMLEAVTYWARDGWVSLDCPDGSTIPASFSF